MNRKAALWTLIVSQGWVLFSDAFGDTQTWLIYRLDRVFGRIPFVCQFKLINLEGKMMRFSWRKANLAMLMAIGCMLGLLVLGGSYAHASISKWVTVGNAGFSDGQADNTSLFIYNGTPYVAYADGGNPNKLTVKKFDGSNWVTVGNAGFSPGTVSYVQLYIYEGTLYVSFNDWTQSGKVMVMKFDGSSWIMVGSGGASPGEAIQTSLYVYQGTPYVAYRDTQSIYKVMVAKYDGSNWVTVGSAVSEGMSYNPSLYVYNGTPYVAYTNYGGIERASVKKYNGSAWELVGAAEFTVDALNISVKVADDGTPYLSYYEYDAPRRTTVMKYNGSNWVMVGGDWPISTTSTNTSLYLDGNTPYVGFWDVAAGGKATVMKYNGSNWEFVGNRGFSAGGSGYMSLFVYNGIPYAAYMDYANGYKATVMTLKNAVLYDGNGSTGGTVPEDPNGYDNNTSATVLGNTGGLTRTGHTFAGWNTKVDGTGTDYAAGNTLTIGTDGVILYAKWNINSYMVSYDGNASESGSTPAGGSRLYNSGVTVPGNTGNLTKTGYSFAGWNTKPDGTGTNYAAGNTFAMGAEDITLYAKWTINSYTVSYDGNSATSGSVPTVNSHNYNTSVTVQGSGSLAKTGHTFTGWNTKADGTGTSYTAGNTFMIGAANVTLYAKWTINNYTVAYDGNGSESGSAPGGGSHVYNTSVTVQGNTGNLVRTGYSFAGWNTKADGTGTNYVAAASFTIGAADVTLYAKWTPNSYTVSYDGNGSTGGSAPTVSSHNYNTSVTVQGSGSLDKTGHTFAGWNTKVDGTGTSYTAGNTFMIGAANVTLYAKWTINSYTVAYDGNGSESGSAPAGGSHIYNTSVTVQDNTGNLVRTGYSFAGWSTKVDGTGTNYAAADAFTIGAADVTLYAKWTPNSYTVAYDGNGSTGGSEPTGGSHDYNTSVTVLDNIGSLEKTGYTFAGWNSKANGTGTNYAAGNLFAIGAADVTLYAKWAINSYTVTYDSNGSTGGSAPTDRTHVYNTNVTVQDNTGNLVRTGYTFAGWNTKVDGSGTNYAAAAAFTIGAADVTLYAKWTVNIYTVTYDGNGSTGGSEPTGSSHDYNTSVTVLDNIGRLEKTGYTFAGWNTKADGSGTNSGSGDTFTIGAADVTLYAKWTINSYTVAYDGNGNAEGTAPSGSSYDYNNIVTVSGNTGSLEKTGYTFSGWNTKADGTGTNYAGADTFAIGAEGLTLYAKWKANSYMIAYDGNGSMGGSAPSGSSHDYDTIVTVPGNIGNLVKTGYSFAGWNTAADGSGTSYRAGDAFSMGAVNLTLYAQWLSSNALLSSLSVDKGTLAPAFSLSDLNYNVDVDFDVSSLNLNLAKADASQIVSVTGAVYLSVTDAVYSYRASDLIVGPNSIRIGVKAEDGTENVYTVTVNRVSGSNADLNGFILSSGTLSPVFAPGRTAYVSNVANGVSSLTVTAAVSDLRATITINGQPVISGQASDAIDLAVGDNPINVEVKARDGTMKRYTVIVKRASISSGNNGDDGSGSGGNGGGATNSGKAISTNGQLTLPVGKEGEVSMDNAVMISIPVGASAKELKLTIEKVLDTKSSLTDKVVLASPVYEILKNFSENFSKPVTLTFAFDPASLKRNQKAAVFYFDEVKKVWVEVGGKVNGNYITVDVNHFTKYAVLAIGPMEEAPTGQPIVLSDISGHWAEANIKQAVNIGIAKGYADGTFKPGKTVTRAEFAVMLMNALNPQAEGAALTFADTAKIGAWAQKAVAQAVQAGIIHGYQDGSFRPDAEITRAEMAVMIASALNLTAESNPVTGFADDKKISSWAKGPVAALKKLGIISGKGANDFVPDGKTTRAEAVTVLLNMLEQDGK
ncbi:InlB B-repeat-containing protein [Cohnella silvisoli]|uniref:InlB B-repeat-containing protein n=1 Tax=Cohnella silvisoli TaxID=2873699 RepID=A0ABV1L461_9BACL|nr:InlB B-repeat-containing protein [Cohnella silvisoli]MCD9026436.1 InlB B-repeat-containing protein [Cohnella silvisoli]